jgi:hypothetical protein
MTSLGVKNTRGVRIWHFRSEKMLPWFREGLCIEAKSRKNIFTPKRIIFRQKLHFCYFSLQYKTFPESGKRFSLRKYQIRSPCMFLLIEVSFTEKISKIFSRGWWKNTVFEEKLKKKFLDVFWPFLGVFWPVKETKKHLKMAQKQPRKFFFDLSSKTVWQHNV